MVAFPYAAAQNFLQHDWSKYTKVDVFTPETPILTVKYPLNCFFLHNLLRF